MVGVEGISRLYTVYLGSVGGRRYIKAVHCISRVGRSRRYIKAVHCISRVGRG